MNILIIGHSGTEGYSYLIKMADKLIEKGNKVIFAVDNNYYPKASSVNLEKYDVYYFDEWERNYIDSRYNDITDEYSNEAAYINYERFKCLNAKKSLKNFSKHVTNDLLKKMFYFIDETVTIENIDCILYETVSSSLSYMAYHVSLKREICFVGWILSRIPGRYDLLNDPFGDINKLEKIYNNVKVEDISEKELKIIRTYLADIGEIKPSYMKNNPFNMHTNHIIKYAKKIGKAFKHINIIMSSDTNTDYNAKYSLELKSCWFKYNLKRQAKILYLKNKYEKVDFNDKYYIFPMHYQPEASTAVNAPFYCNQVDVIKNIAFSLPCGTKLYVKDHPNGIGYMSLKEYRQIFNLPNVVYIDPETNTKELIVNSVGVVTITSTMGYEALLMKKPVVTLGKVFYNYHPYCIHVAGYWKLTEALRNMINAVYNDFETVNIRFVKAYRDKNFEGVLLSEKDIDIEEVAKNILKLIETRINI